MRTLSCWSERVDALVEGKAIGWFQGRMEFGPRALGNRSILGDARSTTMQSLFNRKVKYRGSFRPLRALRTARGCGGLVLRWIPIARTCCW